MTETATTETPAPSERQLAPLGRRVKRAFGPIVAGLILDFQNLSTRGPAGRLLGLPISAIADYWMGRCLAPNRRASLFCALEKHR